MNTRILHARVDPDGTLRLELPLNTPDVELEIVLVFQPRPPATAHSGWTAAAIERIYGTIDDPSFVRHTPPTYHPPGSLA